MAEDVAVKDLAISSCCEEWKNRCLKLEEKLAKSENSRKILRDGVNTFGKQLSAMQTDNLHLKKAYEEEKARAESEREEKVKEHTIRISLENEISTLRSDAVSLKHKTEALEEEIRSLQLGVTDKKAEIEMLEELLQKEKARANSEKRKAEAEKLKANEAWELLNAERSKADEERKTICAAKLKNEEENRLRLEQEAEELRSKLVTEKLKLHEVNTKLEAERQNVIKEKKRADSEMAKTEAQKKVAERSRKSAMDEKGSADFLSQQLEQDRKIIQKLKEEIRELMSSKKLVDANANAISTCLNSEPLKKGDLQSDIPRRDAKKSKMYLDCSKTEVMDKKIDVEKQEKIKTKDSVDPRMRKVEKQKKVAENYKKKAREEKRHAVYLTRKLDEEKQQRIAEASRADSEMKKAVSQANFAELWKKEAMEEKVRANRLAQELEYNREKINTLQNEISELSSGKLAMPHNFVPDTVMNDAEMNLLKKQLKLQKMQLKHAKQLVNYERGCNNILRHEIFGIKQEFFHLSQRLEIMSNCFTSKDEGLKDITGDAANMQFLNMKTKLLDAQLGQTYTSNKNEPVKSTCTGSMDRDTLLPFKLSIPCIEKSLPMSQGPGTVSISGIDSKLDLMNRGSKRKLLERSAKNSSAASFSHRQLMGSQEKCASARLTEEKANAKLDFLGLSSETTSVRCKKNTAIVAENSVRSPFTSVVFEKKTRHDKKRKKNFDAIESIEHLYSYNHKWHMQIAQKLSMLHDILASQIDKPSERPRLLVPSFEGKSHKKRKIFLEEEVNMRHSHGSEEKKNWVGNEILEKKDTCGQILYSNGYAIAKIDGHIDEVYVSDGNGEENFGRFDDLFGSDCMRLLDLDNEVDEESYRIAIERPVSPTLPEIKFQKTEQHEINHFEAFTKVSFSDDLPNEKADLVTFGCFDVINVEIDSNMSKFNASQNSDFPSMNGDRSLAGSLQNFTNHGQVDPEIFHIRGSGLESEIPDTSTSGNNLPDFSFERNAGSLSCKRPKFCVVSLDIIDGNLIYRIYQVLESCMANCSFLSQLNHILRNAMHFLFQVGELSPKEKICVFWSLALNKVSSTVTETCENVDTLFLDSFAGQIRAVLSDDAVAKFFMERCNLSELLLLFEDFLTDRRVLVHGGSSPICDSMTTCILHDVGIFSVQAATTQQLMAGAILVASICASVGQVGLVCEASYVILKKQKVKSSLALAILHVFAYLCGSEYFSFKGYNLVMTVVKSKIRSFEKVESLSVTPLYHPTVSTDSMCQFPSFAKCPFWDSESSIDTVISLLLRIIQDHALSVNSDSLRTYGNIPDGDNGEKSLGQADSLFHVNMDFEASSSSKMSGIACCQTNTVCGGISCYFSDALSLVELIACGKDWKWTYDNVVQRLWIILESSVLEKYSIAILLFIGLLGKMGVTAYGYDDARVESLRVGLSTFLRHPISRNLGFQFQIAAATALCGLLPFNFDDFTGEDLKLKATAAAQSACANSAMKWFSLLSKEQLSLLRLASKIGTSIDCH